MNWRLNLLLLAIVALLGSWYYSQQSSEQGLDNLIKKDGMPEYTGEQMTTSVYDTAGKLQYFAQAKEIKRYEETEKTEFFYPLLNLYNLESGLKEWKVTANHALVTKEKMLHLSGKVKIESLDPLSRLQRIETESLSVNLTNHDIASDKLVLSSGNGFTTEGVGLSGNLKRQVASLKNNVKTFIEPTRLKEDPAEAASQPTEPKDNPWNV